MLTIRKLSLRNFGPFWGDHSLAFPEGVVIVYGENMAGKTSIINALRWGFYGATRGRRSSRLRAWDLLNDEAKQSGDHRFFVEIVTSYLDPDGESHDVRIKRQVQSEKSRASGDADLQEVVEMEVDGRLMPASQIDAEVASRLLPQGISRFFFFDGELLDEYEELVARDGEALQRDGVRRAIEVILGVPAISRGEEDLEHVRKSTRRELTAEGKKHESASEAAENLGLAESRLASIQEDLRRTEAEADEAASALQDASRDLREVEAIREQAHERERLSDQDGHLRRRAEDLRERRRLHAQEVWRDFLSPLLKKRISSLETEAESIRDANQRHAQYREQKFKIEQDLHAGTCQSCGQDLLAANRAHLEDEIARLESLQAKTRPEDLEREEGVFGDLARMKDVAPAGVIAAIAELERELGEVAVERERIRRTSDDLTAAMQGRSPTEVLRFEREAEKRRVQVARAKTQIEALRDDEVEIRRDIEKLQRQMKGHHVPALRALEIKLEILDGLRVVFEEGKAHHVELLRDRVRDVASEIFLRLTTDDSYSALQINEHYGLTIMDSEGQPVSMRSAGAEQVVALSLIGALNALAEKQGPIVMDTPLGRLDEGHRRNILSFLPSMSRQVILLVHGGEINLEKDLAPLSDSITSKVRIVRDNARRRSGFEPIGL